MSTFPSGHDFHVESETRLFIGGMGPQIQSDDLRSFFEKYGSITECNLKCEIGTGKSKGYAFMSFDDPSAIEKVLKDCPHVLGDRKLDVKRAREIAEIPEPMSEIPSSTKIFVGALPESCTQTALRDYFTTFGTVTQAVVITDHDTHQSRGFGFVNFTTLDAVRDVLDAYHDHFIDGKWIETKCCLPRELNRGGMNPGAQSVDTMMNSRQQGASAVPFYPASHLHPYSNYQGGPHGMMMRGGAGAHPMSGYHPHHPSHYYPGSYFPGAGAHNMHSGGVPPSALYPPPSASASAPLKQESAASKAKVQLVAGSAAYHAIKNSAPAEQQSSAGSSAQQITGKNTADTKKSSDETKTSSNKNQVVDTAGTNSGENKVVMPSHHPPPAPQHAASNTKTTKTDPKKAEFWATQNLLNADHYTSSWAYAGPPGTSYSSITPEKPWTKTKSTAAAGAAGGSFSVAEPIVNANLYM